MATRIIEYAVAGASPIPACHMVVAQTPITATTTPASSSAFKTQTCCVCINSDEAVYVAFGSAPTATTSDYRVPANGSQSFCVNAGWKVSVRA